jgi:hypothetical protein
VQTAKKLTSRSTDKLEVLTEYASNFPKEKVAELQLALKKP